MNKNSNYTIKYLKEKNLIIFSAIMGSHAYGTALPTSDTDIRGVFIQPLEDILKYGYVEQVSDKKNDIIYYELQRFLSLVAGNNPNIIELLFAPEDVVQYKHQLFELIEKHRDKFLTKKCKLTFGGYAISQIKKARGYNKKMNWEKDKMVRKNVLDFCYVLANGKTIPLHKWFESYNKHVLEDRDQTDIGLAKVDHAHDIYAMYDLTSYHDIPKGIVSKRDVNDVQLVSIPKEANISGYLTFNKDAYSNHCKKYTEYKIWLEERNPDRVKMNKEHGKNYDSKNMSHTFRLLNIALEIAKTKKLNVRRSSKEIKTLMKIRKGEYDYDKLVNKAEKMIKEMDQAYEESSLPEKINTDFILNLQLKIYKKRFKERDNLK